MTEGRSVGVGVGLIMGGRRVFVGVDGGTGVFVEVGGGFGVFVGAGVFVAGTGVFVGGGTGVDVADKHCTVKGCKVQNGTAVGRGVDVGAGGAGVCVAQNTWSQQERFASSSPSPSCAEIICASVMMIATNARMRVAARNARRRGVAGIHRRTLLRPRTLEAAPMWGTGKVRWGAGAFRLEAVYRGGCPLVNGAWRFPKAQDSLLGLLFYPIALAPIQSHAKVPNSPCAPYVVLCFVEQANPGG